LETLSRDGLVQLPTPTPPPIS